MTTDKSLLDTARKDRIYTLSDARSFAFGDEVASVFDDMISRSVPCYLESQILISSLASKYYKPGTTIYDLGCSTGTSLALIAKRLHSLSPSLVGVDSSGPMLHKAEEKLRRLEVFDLVELEQCHIEEVNFKATSLALLNYTLQFLDLDTRKSLLKRLYQAMVPGGALLLSEKTRLVDSDEADIVRPLHEDFKRQNGYSDSEIARKRESLKGVLVSLSPEENEAMLYRAGFSRVVRVMQGYEFVSWLAVA
jgi:tRNA (cmo5U34)-methyltransferase